MVVMVQLIWLKWWDKKTREIFFLGRNYSAQDAMDMGMVNAVIPHAELEDTAYEWAQEFCKITDGYQNAKFAMNLTDDGMVGQQVLLVKPRLAYMTEEAKKVEMLLEKKKTKF
jgi:naphthoate synthase